jgi:hypothetical protein
MMFNFINANHNEYKMRDLFRQSFIKRLTIEEMYYYFNIFVKYYTSYLGVKYIIIYSFLFFPILHRTFLWDFL